MTNRQTAEFTLVLIVCVTMGYLVVCQVLS
jgi:hypothetical protein